ncbi:hypothetical protein SAMN02745206_02319 [Desulfacinum infernum DSM 9756]|uniref:Uncharacterized protein n=1 Tax=Desulfacinum infernum DSM 9756 TaxID=1121391 RepID=A0A1M5D1J6_9BACT|nr:DUF5663 domain-containing protein [Desulfacinum infernum]SHF60861.1 hypothetical protein SAMN02745206_02319 [Desulfacinum infernum DSM 9756]
MQKPKTNDPETAVPLGIRNPYIVNFMKALVEKKGEKHEPEALKKLLDDMYKLFENMLGQNMVKALPEDKRREYLELSKDLTKVSYKKIEEIFDKYVPNYEEVMKETMKQFTAIFMKNRKFDPKDYPVSEDVQG